MYLTGVSTCICSTLCLTMHPARTYKEEKEHIVQTDHMYLIIFTEKHWRHCVMSLSKTRCPLLSTGSNQEEPKHD